METIHTEICEEPGKRDCKGRRVLGKEEWYRLMADYDQSGLTQAAYCRREGINRHTFVAWLGRRKREGKAPAPASARARERFQEFTLAAPRPRQDHHGFTLEVAMADGTIVRGSDPAALAALIALLGD